MYDKIMALAAIIAISRKDIPQNVAAFFFSVLYLAPAIFAKFAIPNMF